MGVIRDLSETHVPPFFQRFLKGCKRRKGQDWKPNQAFGVLLFLELLNCIEQRIEEASTPETLNLWTVTHTYIIISYVVSLRGPEGFLLDIEGLRYYWKEQGVDDDFGDYIYICLRGQVKGEYEIRCYVLPSVTIKKTGIEVKSSVQRLLSLKSRQGFRDGPTIFDIEGVFYSTETIDDAMIDVLSDLYISYRSLFPKNHRNS